MTQLIPVLKKEDIQQKVASLAKRISTDYEGRELVIVGILKGSFIFISDLVRHITIPVKIDFISVSSYGTSTSSSGQPLMNKELKMDINDKDVLLIDDIVDTGLTLSYLVKHLGALGPRTIKVCALVDKSERREKQFKIDYVCHKVQKGFLVGYGLDYAEMYRNLPEIYHLKF